MPIPVRSGQPKIILLGLLLAWVLLLLRGGVLGFDLQAARVH